MINYPPPLPQVISNRAASTFWEQFPPYTTEAFRAQFDAGYKNYIEGDWRESRSVKTES